MIDAQTLETMKRLSIALEKHTLAMERQTEALEKQTATAQTREAAWLKAMEAAKVLGIPPKKTCSRKLKELSDQGFVRRRNTRPPLYNREDLEALRGQEVF